MNVHICSIKNPEVLQKLVDVTKLRDKKFFFPTFGLSITIENDSKFIERFVSLNSSLPIFSEQEEFGSKILILGDLNSFYFLANELASKGEFELSKKINALLESYHASVKYSYQIGDKTFSGNECYLMGVLNLTTDSFYDGGKYNQPETH